MLRPFSAPNNRYRRFSASAPQAFPITSAGFDESLGGYGTSWNYLFDFEEPSGNLTDKIASLSASSVSGGTKVYRRPGSIEGKHMIRVGLKDGGDTLNGFVCSPADVIGTQGFVIQGSWRCSGNFAASAGIGTYGVFGDANFGGVLFYLPSSGSSFQALCYDMTGTGILTLTVSGDFNNADIHDFMFVRDSTGTYLFTELGSASDVASSFKTQNFTHAQRWSFGRPGAWFGAGAQRGTAWQFAAMAIGNTTSNLCATNGATMLSNFRALRTAELKRKIPVQSPDIKEAIGSYGSNSWKHLLRFQESSGNLTADDSLEVATAAGVAGDDVITYSRPGPVAGHSAIALQDTGAGDGTASRFAFSNALIQPNTGSLACLAVFKVEAAAAATRAIFGMESGGGFDQVQSGGTTGILRHQVFDGTLSNAAIGSIDSDNQWIVALAIFDNPNNAIYLTTNLEDISATGVALGTVANAGKGFLIGSTAGHKSLDFAFFASTNDITDLVANRVAIVDAFAARLGL
jgi:hypothetical protein